MRRARAGVVVGVLVGAVACTGGDDNDEAKSGTTTTVDPTVVESLEAPDLPPYEVASDGGEVRVAETGFSVFADEEGDPLVSWGVVVENTSATDAALYTDFKVDLVDAAGTVVPHENGADRVPTVHVIRPGQRVGFGHTGEPLGSGVAGVAAAVGGSQWVPREGAGVAFGELVPGAVAADLASGKVTFAVDSTYSAEVDTFATTVMRDQGGTIVGGTGRWDALADNPIAPGHQEGVEVSSIPAVPDVVGVDVFVDALPEEDLLAATSPAVETADPDAFCALYEEYGYRMTVELFVPTIDPRAALAPLLAIDPPEPIAEPWQAWRDWSAGAATSRALQRRMEGSLYPEWVGQAPKEIEDEFDEVDDYWHEECGGSEHDGFASFSSFDEPDELPPFVEPESGEIRVVEQGHSQYPSSYGDPLVSYGVVLENTSDQIATNVSVEVTLVGVTEPTPEASPVEPETVEIPVLMPGQRVGVGHTAYGDASAMTGMDVAVDATQWWPPDLRSIELGDISVSELTISPAGHGTLTFTLDSTVPVFEGGTFHAVLRAASGTIVGGGNDVGNVSPGRSFAALDPYTGALPPSADAGTSEVWFQP